MVIEIGAPWKEGEPAEVDRAVRDLRNYIFGLRPAILADRQLGQVIAQLAAALEDKSGITVAVEVDPGLAAELFAVAGDIVQLVRESLSNVARHSGAATGRVSLRREDDGSGFDDKVRTRGQGLGNLRERSRKLGGSLSILLAAAAPGLRSGRLFEPVLGPQLVPFGLGPSALGEPQNEG